MSITGRFWVSTEVEEELIFATAVAVQQLGHAYEDLAAVLAGLACRYDAAFKFDGRPNDPVAEKSLLFVLLNYKGTLKLDSVVAGATAQTLGARVGVVDLASAAMPTGFFPGSAKWILDGIVDHVSAHSTGRSKSTLVPFMKLKHGGVVVSNAQILTVQGVPAGHIGFYVPGATNAAPKVHAAPTTSSFVAEVAAEVDRVRLATNVLVAFYLQRHHPSVWSVAKVTLEQMLDERVVREAKGASLIGVGMDLGTLVRAEPIP